MDTNTTTETVVNEFFIPEENLENLKMAIAKMNRKAARLGCEPVVITVGEPEDRPEVVYNSEGKALKTGRIVRYFAVTVTGKSPRLNGWSFVARLDSLEGGVMVSCTPSFEGKVPTRYRSADTCGDCDHCKLNRRRHQTYLLQNEAGDFTQVGSSCLTSFFAGKSPESIVAAMQLIWEVCAKAESESSGCGGGGDYVDATTYLAHVAAAVRKYGWMSRSAARKYEEAAQDRRASAY